MISILCLRWTGKAEADLVDLPPFLCGLLGEALVNHRHDLVEQLTTI